MPAIILGRNHFRWKSSVQVNFVFSIHVEKSRKLKYKINLPELSSKTIYYQIMAQAFPHPTNTMCKGMEYQQLSDDNFRHSTLNMPKVAFRWQMKVGPHVGRCELNRIGTISVYLNVCWTMINIFINCIVFLLSTKKISVSNEYRDYWSRQITELRFRY